MQLEERICLDATLVSVLQGSAFRAELQNGHRLVAFVPARREADAVGLELGQTVQVILSPYDMSRGEIHRTDRGEGL